MIFDHINVGNTACFKGNGRFAGYWFRLFFLPGGSNFVTNDSGHKAAAFSCQSPFEY